MEFLGGEPASATGSCPRFYPVEFNLQGRRAQSDDIRGVVRGMHTLVGHELPRTRGADIPDASLSLPAMVARCANWCARDNDVRAREEPAGSRMDNIVGHNGECEAPHFGLCELAS